uniref:Uncharacterized protein n=1 Tax=Chromera velia CCMP2878 TaxID=1169474 RepID=A0A0G4FIF7_9ALVE|eukprot:Cvel_17180.t1-p1 / transcript=Cvel_17180.t1 / gene=Cvel_17180 / organism=Chromera_velia_CCMP2878 / gene_product=hypothetical protein / transcript_product=hypothetical protein / location=Cvel_scaffold1357:23093-23740(+) / protein_length=216 / sequence_SO=supercontig / SO=protein_coding / is_pseudo=false
MSIATERAFCLLVQTVRYLKGTPNLGIPIRPSPNPHEFTGVYHADASFGNASSPHPQSSRILFLNGSPIGYKSRRQPRVARSTIRVEVLSLEDAVDDAIYTTLCISSFYQTVRLAVGCDAANVFHLIKSGAPTSAERALLPVLKGLNNKACVVPLLAATDLTELHQIAVFKIPTDQNISDVLTKALNVGFLNGLMQLTSTVPSVFGEDIVASTPPF